MTGMTGTNAVNMAQRLVEARHRRRRRAGWKVVVAFTERAKRLAGADGLAEMGEVSAMRTLAALISALQTAGLEEEAEAIITMGSVFVSCAEWPAVNVEALALWDDICRALALPRMAVMGPRDYEHLLRWRSARVAPASREGAA